MTEIKGTTRVCGLIGNPVEHSISPLIHNTLAELLGYDLAYVTYKVEGDMIEAAIKGAYALNVLGLNVTVPHKQAVIGQLVSIDPLAEAIGAVNTLVRTEGGFKGYNTDIIGLKRELNEEGVNIKGQPVVILGAGGASRAIAFLCAENEASRVYILNRTTDKAKMIANAVNDYFGKDVVVPMSLSDYDRLGCDDYVVIQTTSVGLHPHDDETVIEDDVFYERAAAGVDIIYNPSETKFMKLMRMHGKPAYNGLKMLLYQAVAAYELFTDSCVSKDIVDEVYETIRGVL